MKLIKTSALVLSTLITLPSAAAIATNMGEVVAGNVIAPGVTDAQLKSLATCIDEGTLKASLYVNTEGMKYGLDDTIDTCTRAIQQRKDYYAEVAAKEAADKAYRAERAEKARKAAEREIRQREEREAAASKLASEKKAKEAAAKSKGKEGIMYDAYNNLDMTQVRICQVVGDNLLNFNVRMYDANGLWFDTEYVRARADRNKGIAVVTKLNTYNDNAGYWSANCVELTQTLEAAYIENVRYETNKESQAQAAAAF
ncbi:hypothetical protein VP150E351_P0224 [Vibrio phage 150E35-1]|nr:hypothetical protein VP150E351_P0224 [Vibrio phage 150E35-1]